MPRRKKTANKSKSLPRFDPLSLLAEFKSRSPGSMIMFRMGDFYEMFGEDAEQATSVLGLTVTTRIDPDGTSETKPLPMAGFPYTMLEANLAKLARAGFRIAVCEQISRDEVPAVRQIERIVTPGNPAEFY